MAEHHDTPTGMRGGDALDGRPQATPEHGAGLGAGDDVPALLAQHRFEHGIAVHRLLAQQAALPLAEVHLPEVRVDDGAMPVRSTSGAAVWAVRRRVLTYTPSMGSWASRNATCSAWCRPASDSGGSPWPSTSSKDSPSTESADAPWRTSRSSVEPGGPT